MLRRRPPKMPSASLFPPWRRLLQHFLGDPIRKALKLRQLSAEDETVQPRLVGNDSSRLHADLYAEYCVQKHAEHN